MAVTMMNRSTSTGSSTSRSTSQSISNNAKQQPQPPGSTAAASASLALLLREDRLLTQHELHVSGKTEEVAFSYAAALLQEEQSQHSGLQQQAKVALAEVERKLALVQSLAERVSRTSPEAVAGPLLRLHGYALEAEKGDETASAQVAAPAATLVAIRERCNRLKRQGELLDGVARRVESSLQRGLQRMETATSRLSRVLDLSATLKMILRLQFESSKLQSYDLDDLRDLTRAAASVAVVEDLLSRPELQSHQIQVVEAMRPDAERTASAVRRAAAALLSQHQQGSSTSSAVVHLGATLQVYYHLGELPKAAWSTVEHALQAAQQASMEFWSPASLTSLMEAAHAEAKLALGSSKKPAEAALQRALKKKLKELRDEGSSQWAAGIAQASMQVWNLHRVLCRKSDPVTRQTFVDVVSAAPIPEDFQEFDTEADFSVFSIFWNRVCYDLGQRLEEVLNFEKGKLTSDIAALYPAARSAALDMLGSLYDTMQAGSGGASLDDNSAATSSAGLLGGSAALDDAFWSNTLLPHSTATSTFGMASADTWTRTEMKDTDDIATSNRFLLSSGHTKSLSSIFQSNEWKTLQASGLFPLQQAFLEACSARLCAPIQFMFPEGLAIDEDGVAVPVLPALPSRYDLQKLDANIRQELSLADPREGGGELSMTTMIAEVVVDMVEQFCERAKNAVSDVGEDRYLHADDGSATEVLIHDLKVAGVMSTLATSLRNAPENTFVVPYRPATSAQHEEAASLCQIALMPALHEIGTMVKSLILTPLCRAINQRVASSIAKIHHGAYLEESLGAMDGMGTSFVQKHLNGLFERIAEQHLSSLPAEYASIVASTVATFSIYTFVSNASLIRPLGETSRLHITQDLADFELALEQLVLKAGSSLSLSHVDHGKPYAELRAVRQMLFWTGLDDKSTSASVLAKSMLREVWVKDVRPSTVFHFLFSFAPALLSSPHHSKRMRPEDYVSTLVRLNGSIDDGEASAWMTTMACCDSYQQRESVDGGGRDGDRRVPALLMMLGPELLRRRRN